MINAAILSTCGVTAAHATLTIVTYYPTSLNLSLMFASRPRFSTRTLVPTHFSTLSKPAAAVPKYRGWRQQAIYVDRGVLVINKPSGLASQPAPSNGVSDISFKKMYST